MHKAAGKQRFTLIATNAGDRRAAFTRDVQEGLQQNPKRLSCCFFYDREGSDLFEAICALPEYYLTRAEHEVLEAHADDIAARLPSGAQLVELGSGNSAKTRLLIEAFLLRQESLRYVSIDICRAILQESGVLLLEEYPDLEMLGIAAEYQEGLRQLRQQAGRPQLILWLGSNVGNFHRPEAADFLHQVRDVMAPADRLLMGVDLRKDRSVLERAYDDAQGVTAEFNLNLLTRINRELGGNFDLEAFQHRAIYEEEAGRIEMYLVSKRAQRVRMAELDFAVDLAAGEAIHTENSYKYSHAEIDQLAAAAGLRIECRWHDRQERFSVNLLAPA